MVLPAAHFPAAVARRLQTLLPFSPFVDMPAQPMEVVLNEKPTSGPDANTFRLQPIANPPITAPANGVLLQLVVASVDPYQRNSILKLDLGSPVSNYQVARVLQSNHPDYQPGDLVLDYRARITWASVQQHDGRGLYRIPPELNIPATAWAGVLGMPGRTAYFGLMDHEVGRMERGKVVLVSGAAGAVGSLVGQLARLEGAERVIGTAGGPEKCRLLRDKYRFDFVLDYKEHDTADKMREALRKAAPNGIDLFFDNTGGHVLTAAFSVLNKYARMVLCGNIASYNKRPEDDLVPNLLSASAQRCIRVAPRLSCSSPDHSRLRAFCCVPCACRCAVGSRLFTRA